MINTKNDPDSSDVKSKIRILHLEDHHADAEVIARLLTKAKINFEARVVDTREQYQKALNEFKPEIIISDHSLPSFNSMEALKMLKLSGQKIPFMLVTGAVSEEFAIHAMHEGADDYILKDRMQRLPVAVLGALEKYALDREEKRKDTLLRNIDVNSLDMICSIDEAGRFVHMSAASKAVLGYNPSELCGEKYLDLVHEDDFLFSSEVASSVMNGSLVRTLENRFYRKDGAIVHMLWSARWENSEKIMYCVGKDVTDQTLMRQRIEESKNEYVHLVQNLPAALYTCDATGKIVLYNKAAVELWGREPNTADDLWCSSCEMLDNNYNTILPESSPMARAVSEGRNVYGEEIIIKRADGTIRNVVPYPSPSFSLTGVITGAINMVVDITERKKIETETLTLVDLLKFKNRELKQFAYMVSHNLRAPIARILGLASVFGNDIKEDVFILEKIKEASTDLDSVVKDINLVVSARNLEEVKVEYVDFQAQVDRIVQDHEKEIRESSALIETDFQNCGGLVTVPSYVYSIMHNLISNAIKYRLMHVPLRIDIKTTMDAKFICLSVKDNGTGVDLVKNGEKIFGLYKRFHGNEIQGKGIGLHLVKTHAESLGGKVEIESKINEGIEFKIFLPMQNDHTTT